MSATDAAEIAAHEFVALPNPPTIIGKLLAAASPKTWMAEFGVYGCPCVAKSLPLLQMVMLIRGDIQDSLDVYQGCYHPGVGASAGSHDRGGPVDLGQFTDRHIQTARECGWGAQHRTTAQGFSGDHNHQFPIGCSHGSPLAMYQQRAWQAGRNGLVSNGPITGPGPIGNATPHWTEGVQRMQEEIVSFADQLVARFDGVLAKRLAGLSIPRPADFWRFPINVSRDPKKVVNWGGDHIISHIDRHQDSVDRTLDQLSANMVALTAQVVELKALVNGVNVK